MTVMFEPKPSRYAVESWDQRVVKKDGLPERHEKWCVVRYFRHLDEANQFAQDMADKYPRQKWRVAPDRRKSELRFVVSGVPVPQGSLKHVGRGRFVSDNTRLGPWRDKVSAAALAVGGPSWRDVDEPVSLHVVFWLPKPKRPRFPVPAVKPDLDKLQRAIGDALSPRTGPKVLAEDSRIIRATTEKHYAAPGEERAEITLRKEHP